MDTLQIIHLCLTGATLVGGLVLGYFKLKDKSESRESKEQRVCFKDMQEIKTKLAVLESRLNNEAHLLDRLADTLDDVRDKL